MISSDFLRMIDFSIRRCSYTAESILRAQVRALGWHMMMEPGLEALHAHRSSAKGSPIADSVTG